MRKLAREAVIFMLIAFALGAVGGIVQQIREHRHNARWVAGQAVFAVDVPPVPRGYVVSDTVVVPLTNGTKLYVLDCVKLHPELETSPQPPAGTKCKDGMFFTDWFKQFGGNRSDSTSVSLGDVNQLAIEKLYWQAYKDYENRYPLGWETAILSLVFGAISAAAGLALWAFYRLVRFAVKG
jgi:hypothetical protein